jgi:hypothetical protein
LLLRRKQDVRARDREFLREAHDAQDERAEQLLRVRSFTDEQPGPVAGVKGTARTSFG